MEDSLKDIDKINSYLRCESHLVRQLQLVKEERAHMVEEHRKKMQECASLIKHFKHDVPSPLGTLSYVENIKAA